MALPADSETVPPTEEMELLQELARREGAVRSLAHDREVMEHAIIAFVGLEFLDDAAQEKDTIVRDELGSNAAECIFDMRAQLVWVIARKAADVYRRGNGLPIPDERNTDV